MIFNSLKQIAPSASDVEENAATLCRCEEPEMFCGRWIMTQTFHRSDVE